MCKGMSTSPLKIGGTISQALCSLGKLCRLMEDNNIQGLYASNMACAHLESNVGQWNATSTKGLHALVVECVHRLSDLCIGLR